VTRSENVSLAHLVTHTTTTSGPSFYTD